MKVIEAIKAINLYPIPRPSAESIAEECGLDPVADMTRELRASKAWARARALTYQHLAEAPAVTEAGTTYSFTDKERETFLKKAAAILEEAGIEDGMPAGSEVGWIGEDL